MGRVGRIANRAKRSKYGAQRTICDGITFHSKRESERYRELRLLEKAGEIYDLKLQLAWPLAAWSAKEPAIVGTYVCDFWYRQRDGTPVVEDVKAEPTKTPLYRWKKKHLMMQYGIQIREV